MVDKRVEDILLEVSKLVDEKPAKPSVEDLIKSAATVVEKINFDVRKKKATCKECRRPAAKYGLCEEVHGPLHEAAVAKARAGREFQRKDGYIGVYDADGRMRLKHRVVMETKIGRPLLREEEVAFLDGNRLNCEIDNLVIRTKGGEIICPHCSHQFTIPVAN